MTGNATRIIEIHEREARVFPRADLFDHLGRSLVLPETRALSAVELRDVVEGIQLRALGLVGYLPLTNDIVLNLKPKFSTNNLWYMLNAADETYENILPILRSYQKTQETPPHHLLVRGFCFFLQQILSLGIVRGYYQEQYQGYFRPKVEFGKTIGKFLARGNELSTSSNVVNFSAKLRINSFLKSACIHFLRLIPKLKIWIPERQLLEAALEYLRGVQSITMGVGDERQIKNIPRRLRDSYGGALSVYSMLLGYTNIGFSYDSEGSALPSFLFCLDNVFESFVRNKLREGLHEDEISVTDGNKTQNQGHLFYDNKQFSVKPDIILKRKKKIIAIGEVKYKEKLQESDRYQVISHAIALNSKIGIWVSPSITEGDSGLKYIGAVGDGIKFYHYKINLQQTLSDECVRMVGVMSNLLAKI